MELTVIGLPFYLWRSSPARQTTLARLRYLHVDGQHSYSSQRELQPPQPFDLRTPNIVHLALHTSFVMQTVPLLQSIDMQRCPLLTHCHIRHDPSADDETQALFELRARLGNVWCISDNYVARWRADRVWRRSVKLPDPREFIYP